ncbi:mammalian ependymin-related protein 1-like [Pomacea canaliculata]|uniref:mammalian ependymin-related protein 1-like n=1 Tax=Pomacea canaliculata TaxID=400727 RepID=UPI000D72F3FA|nr:mammalian ependymin-related protein 1-like [Pomacea canaliculata]
MDHGVLFVVVVVAVLGLSTAQTKYCCTPDQWQGLLNLTVEGQGFREYGINYISYDYTNRRLAFFWNLTDSSGQVSTHETLELYSGPNSGMRYTLDFQTRKCVVQKVSGPFTKFCIPGAVTESLPVTVYSLPGQNTSQTLVTVTHDLCVIVSEVSVIEDKGDISTSVSRFTDIHLGIIQPSVFDVPPECKDAKPLHSQKVMEIDDNGGVWENGVETMKGFA